MSLVIELDYEATVDAIMALGDHPNIEDVVLILHAAKEAHLAAFPKPEDFGLKPHTVDDLIGCVCNEHISKCKGCLVWERGGDQCNFFIESHRGYRIFKGEGADL